MKKLTPKDVVYTNTRLKYNWRFLALQGCQMIENMGLISNKYFMSMSCTPSNYVSHFHVGEESYRPMTIIYYTKGPFQLTSHQCYAKRKDSFEPFFSSLYNKTSQHNNDISLARFSYAIAWIYIQRRSAHPYLPRASVWYMGTLL